MALKSFLSARSANIAAAIVALAASLSFSSQCSAAFKGKLWIIAAGTNAEYSSLPTTPPDVTFTTDHINFIGSGPTTTNPKNLIDYRIGDFLQSTHTTSNIVYSGTPNAFLRNKPVASTTKLDDGVINGAAGTYETFVELTGSVVLHDGECLTITHGDGANMMINGSQMSGFFTTGPGYPNSQHFTWTNTTAKYTIDMIFVAEGGGPAQLVFSSAAQVP